MTEMRLDDLVVRITVTDARTARDAGTRFAQALAGAWPADFALALAEQDELIQRAIVEAGFDAGQAMLAAGFFEAAARAEWARIANASGDTPIGRA